MSMVTSALIVVVGFMLSTSFWVRWWRAWTLNGDRPPLWRSRSMHPDLALEACAESNRWYHFVQDTKQQCLHRVLS